MSEPLTFSDFRDQWLDHIVKVQAKPWTWTLPPRTVPVQPAQLSEKQQKIKKLADDLGVEIAFL